MRPGLFLAVVATLCLGAATPPALLPAGEWLVLPGLAALYAMATTARRPLLLGYLVGAVHLLWLSWSLRHVSVPGTVGIALIGGFYTVLVVAWTRAGDRFRLGSVWFGLGVAGAAWLRAHAPEIPYPHGQPIHALWQWPALLVPLRIGGEPLGNLLLAWVAAGAVDLWRSWRVARPGRWRAAAVPAVALGLFAASSWLAGAVLPEATGPEVRVVALQTGPFGSLADRNAFRRWSQERLHEPTLAIAGPAAPDPPDLVLWPESTLPQAIVGEPAALSPRDVGIRLHDGTALVAGTVRVVDPTTRRVAAAQIEGSGRLVGWHEKRVPVPGGERLPFARFLPESWQRAMVSWGTSLTEDVPDLEAGERRPPLRTRSGVPFAALICFDNAFDFVVREAVADGARMIAVLSNESWYELGAELDQMAAMSVCRAVETRTPLVRATIDGLTMAVDGDGRIVAELPRGGGPEVLDVRLRGGPGRVGPLAWLAPALGQIGLLAGVLVLWLRRGSCGRLAPSRTGRATDRSSDSGIEDAG